MKFRKKHVLVDAVQYTPGLEDGYTCYVIGGGRFVGYHDKRTPIPPAFRKVPAIKTIRGFEEIRADDWIITDAAGERYLCKAKVFAQTYETADGPPHEEEAHERIRDEYAYATCTDRDEYSFGVTRGIECVLEALGIKIEGVNV